MLLSHKAALQPSLLHRRDTKQASKESHDFLISKNLDIFNSVYKELDLYYVDTLNPEKTIKGASTICST